MSEDKNQKASDVARAASKGEMTESEIDRSLMESFPASDPPPWTLGTDHQAEAPAPLAEQSDEKK